MNIISRRNFFDHSVKLGLGVAVSSLVDIPWVMKRALAENAGSSLLGRNGKKLLFIFLRGANDGLNSVIPIGDSLYASSRPTIGLKPDPGADYTASGIPCDFPISPTPGAATFTYTNAIRLGNGFSALHPSLKFLAPVYNAGDLALIHRTGYPNQSRSHFDSQNYWENGNPNNNLSKDGIFYRTIIESGLANTAPLTGVSIQSALPLSLRGSKAAMTNLTDPTRYNLRGIPDTADGNNKADAALRSANEFLFPDKRNRNLLSLQYKNLTDTLSIFASINFTEAGNTYVDDEATDGDAPYALFPTSNAKNGGYAGHGNDINKYVVDTGAYSFFNNLKAAAIVLNKTDAIIAGTQLDGFDTHSKQGSVTGSHPNLQRRIAWAMYGLRKYFLQYHDKATWDNLVVVTLSEFGRTTVENSDQGTDHAEANVMFVAGGAVKGYNKTPGQTGIFGGSPSDKVPWVPGNNPNPSMLGASSRYLKRAVDYRSVLGKLIRDHLGASQDQLNRIIPGYTDSREKLQDGGTSTIEKTPTPIIGEVPIV